MPDQRIEPSRIAALTLWQPWATLMAIGAKRIETRSWPCPAWLIGKPLAIHAAAAYRVKGLWLPGIADSDPFFRPALYAAGYDTEEHYNLPHGAVVAVVRVTACVHTETIHDWVRTLPMPDQEWAFGDYTDGRFGWFTELLHRFEEPIPAKGHQGLWKWTVPAGALEGVTL